MGYELYREVKKWAPETLTHREKLTAMVLADDANEATRLTWSSVVDPEIMRQAMVKNERDMRKILARLQDEGVIERAGGGHNGRVAKYRFLRLNADVAGSNQTGYGPDLENGPVQKEPATEAVGGSNRHSRRSKKNPPTPFPSSTTPPPSPPPPPAPAPTSPPTEEREGGGSAAPNEQEQAAFKALVGIVRTTHLVLGELELRRLAPLAARWLERGTEQQLRQALTAGLPEQVGSPAGLLRRRLLEKLPPAPPAPSETRPQVPKWCGGCGDSNPAAAFNIRFRRVGGQPCRDCHPHAQQAA